MVALFTQVLANAGAYWRCLASGAAASSASFRLMFLLLPLSPQLNQPSLKWGEQKDAVEC